MSARYWRAPAEDERLKVDATHVIQALCYAHLASGTLVNQASEIMSQRLRRACQRQPIRGLESNPGKQTHTLRELELVTSVSNKLSSQRGQLRRRPDYRARIEFISMQRRARDTKTSKRRILVYKDGFVDHAAMITELDHDLEVWMRENEKLKKEAGEVERATDTKDGKSVHVRGVKARKTVVMAETPEELLRVERRLVWMVEELSHQLKQSVSEGRGRAGFSRFKRRRRRMVFRAAPQGEDDEALHPLSIPVLNKPDAHINVRYLLERRVFSRSLLEEDMLHIADIPTCFYGILRPTTRSVLTTK
ncbi:hypothetical protein V5O48_009849 [Marasmius crinis-equi]|uniref:Uncharacterized protein n=1 Tax=Marasmius crinis-equi TaxID=585013 RepID=A0ABR3FAC8_9AGAR